MSARVRDGVGIAILLTAAVVVRLVWHPLGPWFALGVAFAAALGVIAVYRLQAPVRRGPASAPPTEAEGQERVLLRRDRGAAVRVSTRRRA